MATAYISSWRRMWVSKEKRESPRYKLDEKYSKSTDLEDRTRVRGPRTSKDRVREMRDRKTRDSYRYRRSPYEKGPKRKARTSEKAGKRRRRRELLKGPRTSKDRETESRKTRKTADLCQKYRVRPQKDRETEARTSEKAGKRRRRRELLKGPRTSKDRETERPRDRE